jgi:HK97 family phage major capsid protein
MAMTLVTAQNLTNDKLVKGIIEAIVKESAVLKYLPFMELTGSALTYNVETSLGGTAWYAVGDAWQEDALTTQQRTATLKILGGDVDVDNFLEQTFRDPNELRAEAVERKAKALAYEFNNAFFNGTGAANQMPGLNTLAAAGQTLNLGADGQMPTLEDYDALIDMVKPGKPDALFMSKRTRRHLKKLRRGSSLVLESDVDQFGRRVEFYDGIPIEVDDNIKDDFPAGGAGNTGSKVYAVQFGYGRGVMGLSNGLIQAEEVGHLETKDAFRVRLKWYVGLVNFRDAALAVMTNVLDG